MSKLFLAAVYELWTAKVLFYDFDFDCECEFFWIRLETKQKYTIRNNRKNSISSC